MEFTVSLLEMCVSPGERAGVGRLRCSLVMEVVLRAVLADRGVAADDAPGISRGP